MKLEQILPTPKLPTSPAAQREQLNDTTSRQLRIAQERFAGQLWSEAITECERTLQLDSKCVEARLLLARAAMRHGNDALAQTHLNEVLQSSPREPAAYQMLGQLAWEQGKTTDAINNLRLALLASPSGPPSPEAVLTHLTLGFALRKEGYLAAAADQLEAFLVAAESPTPDMNGHIELAEVLALYRGKAAGMIGEIQTELGHYDLAARAYERAVQANPDDTPLRIRWAKSIARAGRIDAAINAVRAIMKDAVDDSSLNLLGEVCELAGRANRYDEELARLADTTQSKAMRRKLAGLLLARGKDDAAAGILTGLLEGDGFDTDAACLVARLDIKREAYRDALTLIARILSQPRADSGDVIAVLQGVTPTARDRLLLLAAEFASTQPASPQHAYLHGRLLLLAGKPDQAAAEFEKAASQDEKFGPAQAALAQVLAERHDWKAVLKTVNRALDLGAGGSELHLLAGRAHQNLDEFEEAETSFLESFRLNPKSAEPLFLLAESAERRGEKKKCEQVLRRVLDDVDARHVAAREKLVRLYLNTDRLQQAKDYFSDFGRLGLTGPHVERCRAMLELATSNLPSGQARLDEYRAALAKIARDFPADRQTLIDLAMSYFATADLDEAAARIDQALAIDSDDVRALEMKAALLSRELDFAAAEKIVRRLLTFRPRDLNYMRQLLDLALNQADWSAALALIDSMLDREELKNTRELMQRQRIEYLLLADRFDDAIKAARGWLDDSPNEPARRDALVAALRGAKKNGEVVELTAKWLADDPANSALRVAHTQALLAADRFEHAEQKVLGWLASDADDVTLNRILLTVFWREKKWTSAIELAQTAAEVPEHRAAFQAALGLTYRLAGKFDDAVDLYQTRVKLAPSDEAYDDLLSALIAAERFKDAEQVINQLLGPQIALRDAGKAFDPGLVINLRQRLASIHEMTERTSAAIEQLEEAWKLAPKDPGLNNDLGYTLVDAGLQLDRAEKMVRFAVAEQPRNSAYLDSLGWTYYKQGNIEQAVAYIERAVMFGNENDPVLFDHLADAHYRLGHKDRAIERWRKSMEVVTDRLNAGSSPADRRLKTRLEGKLRAIAENRPAQVADLATRQSRSPASSQQAEPPAR